MENKDDIQITKPVRSTLTIDPLARSFLEASLDPMFVISREGIICDVNRPFMQLTGLKKRQVNGTAYTTLFSEPDRLVNALKQVIENSEPQHVVCEVSCNGRIADVLLQISPYRTNKTEISGAIALVRDITVQRQSEEQSSRLSAIVTSSSEAIISKTLQGLITGWNNSAEKIFGFTSEEALGQTEDIIIPAELLEDEQDFTTRIQNGDRPAQFESLRKRKDGRIINVSVSLSPIKDGSGKILGVSEIVREITDQKKFEKELIEARRTAEREKELAQDAMKAKQQFLSNMSHEIRTPLNAIIGFTKVVLKSNLTEKQREYLNAIRISGDALIVLVNDILDLSKIEAGKMTFEQVPFRITESVSSMLRLFETKLFKKRVELINQSDARIPEVVKGDPSRLNQVILNLVGNAVKFTSEGRIIVSTKLLNETPGEVTVEFSVKDTGIGIEPSELDHIFDNFSQASGSTARLYGGTGLGLAIVRQLVLSQGGSVSVKSKPGEGSTFSFELTFAKTAEKPERKDEQEWQPSESVGNIRVLVVEDVALNQLLMKTLLGSFGVEVVIAANGKIALEKLKKQRFDLIFMDLQMPEMNGYEATEQIRNVLKITTPIIALTADVTTADVEKCKAVGMNDYLSKPVDDKLLYSKILHYADKPGKAEHLAEPILPDRPKPTVINLEYLKQHTKGNPEMMRQMITTYLEETPRLINHMKQSINGMDWKSLKDAAHALIPSFTVVGINSEYEEMTKKIKEHAARKEKSVVINSLVMKIEDVCIQAIKELENELVAL